MLLVNMDPSLSLGISEKASAQIRGKPFLPA
jgi:hypothetical protein